MFKLVSERAPNENDPLSLSLDELARTGAKKLLSLALKLEVQEYIEQCAHLKDRCGHQVVLRNGKGREKNILLGSGVVSVKAPQSKYSSKILKCRISLTNSLS